MDEKWLTRREIAARMAVSEKTVQRLEVKHGIPVLMAGGRVRYDTVAISALEDACRAAAQAAQAAQKRPNSRSWAPSPVPPPPRASGADDWLGRLVESARRKRKAAKRTSRTEKSGRV